MPDQPRIEIPKKPIDYVLEGFAALVVVAMLLWVIAHFPSLPDRIPRHFNAAGQPDAFGSKQVLWVLPVVAILMFVGLTTLSRFPHVFNYPKPITQDNAEKQYRLATQMIRTLNLVMAAGFAYIVYSTVQVGLGLQSSLGGFFLPIFLISVFATIGIYLFQAMRS